jgi:phage terminase large subunit
MAAPDWFDFRNPDYDRVYTERANRLSSIRKQPEILKGLKEFYKDHPVEFINDWMMTFDPRNAEIGRQTLIPMILFPKQEEFVTWVMARWRGREDGLAEKSRDMGVSWLCVCIAVWMWTFYPGAVVGFGSRKEEYVDKLGDPKSLFWKVRKAIDLLPTEFKPVGYEESKHAPSMRIINPENGAAIVGEAGDNIGRGNRTSIYFKDESAFYERPQAIDAALSQTSNCKIDVSTVNGNGNPFYTKRHSGKIPVFTFHWRDDPRKDAAWYQKQKDTLDPVIVAQEIDIDYNASVADSWISGDDISTAQRNGPADVQAIGKWRIGVDAAHFGDDESVIHCRKARLNLKQITRRGLDGTQLAALVEATIDDLLESGDELDAIIIELDGPGVSCYDQLRIGKYKAFVHGTHTGATLKDSKNYNVRAKMWRDARDYLANGPVSMPTDGELRSQLASVKYKYKDGLLIMQSKKEYKAEFGKSPDRADAFVLTFVPAKQSREGRQFQTTPPRTHVNTSRNYGGAWM